MNISANEVKVKGVSIFSTLLEKAQEIVINVRGKNKYVVVDIDRYNELRELEIEKAYQDSISDKQAGRYKVLTAQEHLEELAQELRNGL